MSQNEHSFYKEAKKSFLAEDGLNWKKISKKLFKYLKITIYVFLVVITLWGCVNQFRHSTSGSVSQGLEFYSDYDSVLPNLYNGSPTSQTYQIVDDKGTDENEDNISDEELVPLDFYTINPNYNPSLVNSDEAVEGVNYSDLFILSSEQTDASGNPNAYYLSYSVNYYQSDILLFKYDWSKYSSNFEDYIGWTLPWITIPTSINDQIIADGGDLNGDQFINMYELYLYIGFDYNESNVDDPQNALFTVSEDGTVTASTIFDAYLVPKTTMYNSATGEWDWNNTENWEIITGIDYVNPTESEWDAMDGLEKNDVINDQIVYYTNIASFLLHEGVSSTDPILTDGSSIEYLVLESFGMESTSFTYSNNYWPLTDLSLYEDRPEADNYTNLQLYSGIGYTIIPQDKASPLYPTPEAINTFQNAGLRESDWYLLDNGDISQAGTQERTDQAGWIMLDEDGNLLSLENVDNSEDVQYLYGDNPDQFRDNILSYRSPITESDPGETSAKYQIDSQLSFSPGLKGSESVDVDYNPYFIGLIPLNEYYNPDNDATIGVTATPQQTISASGQSPINENRDIFAGSVSDWGDSWAPDYGPMYGIFVYPLAQLSLVVNSWFPYTVFGVWGILLGILIITFMLRGLGVLMSLGSSKNQYKMQEIQPLIAEINAKYAMYDKSNKQMKQKKQMETMALYKKHEINPFSSLGTIFVTLPIFLSLFTIISAIPIYKTASLGVFSFSVSSFYGMFNIPSMFVAYMLVGVCVGFSQAVSSKLPGWLSNKRRGIKQVDDATKQAMKKQRRTQNILVGVFVFIGLTVSVLLAIYWIFSALFSIINELSRHGIKQYKAKKIKLKSK